MKQRMAATVAGIVLLLILGGCTPQNYETVPTETETVTQEETLQEATQEIVQEITNAPDTKVLDLALELKDLEACDLTRKRVYELTDILSTETGQPYEDQAAGVYVDRNEKQNISNALYLEYLGAGTYDTWIGLDQKRTLEGTARADGDHFSFLDPRLSVTGTIKIQETGAVLTITESEWEEAPVGTVIQFPEKYEYPSEVSFADLSGLEFWFGSGAGAWSTVLYIQEDGTFYGIAWASGYPGGMGYHAALPFYGLYNVEGEQGFSSHLKTE